MSIPLIDFRGKVTPETDAVLEAILSDVAIVVLRARAIAMNTTEIALIREVIDEWALRKADIAKHLQSVLGEINKAPEPKIKNFRKIPKRRKDVFEAAGGKCHYCGVALDLSGKWHVDHKMPRALMGSDDMVNLTAACVPCNLAKRDKTDVEFIAERAA